MLDRCKISYSRRQGLHVIKVSVEHFPSCCFNNLRSIWEHHQQFYGPIKMHNTTDEKVDRWTVSLEIISHFRWCVYYS